MMRWPAVASLLTLAAFAGCEAPRRILPGRAAVRVEVHAQPKKGYRALADSGYPESSDGGLNENGPYTPVDYARLPNIIVWLEPEHPTRPPEPIAQVTRIPLDSSRREDTLPWHAASVGSALVFQNAGPVPDRFYSVAEGNSFDTGELASGAEARAVLAHAGSVEVFSTHREHPLVGVWVVPTVWAAATRSNRAVTFSDLPPGNYRVFCWHPRLPGAEQHAVLPPDRLTRVHLTIGVDSLPELP